MSAAQSHEDRDSLERLEKAYKNENPRFLARLRLAGRSLEEAEDLLHDVYAETLGHLHLVTEIVNLPAWINTLLSRRFIDVLRRDRTRASLGEIEVAEDTLREVIAGVGLDPGDAFVQESLVEALNDALRALPPAQRQVVEYQVFGGMTFRQIAEATGENIDTLMARKRYAVKRLSAALRHWIDD